MDGPLEAQRRAHEALDRIEDAAAAELSTRAKGVRPTRTPA
jgi:hypothetical protein